MRPGLSELERVCITVKTKMDLSAPTVSPMAPALNIEDASQSSQAPPFSAMTTEMQEAFIIEDLLYIMMGMPGHYITIEKSTSESELRGPRYVIAPGLDSALKDSTQSILRMARNYSAVTLFSNLHAGSEYGSINHALSASIRSLISEYLVLVAQLEHQFLTNPDFTLQSLGLYVRPTAQSLAVIYDLVQDFLPKEQDGGDDYNEDNMEDILEQLKNGTVSGDGLSMAGSHKKIKGGAVLELLTARLRLLSGDPIAKKILSHLLKESSVPYTAMLNMWIHHGVVRDAHDEFLIREQSSIRKEGLKEDYTGVYWDKRYTIRKTDVPTQLENIKDKILLAGKYLNVVRECSDLDIASGSDASIPTTFDDVEFLENIDRAYAHANNTLLSLLLKKHEFGLRMTSMKYYFFLSNSDFFTGFQHHAAVELSKPYKAVNRSKLQSLLDINIHVPGTIAGNDKFNHDIKVDLAREGLFDLLGRINSVTGLDEESAKTGKWTETVATTPETDLKEISGYNAFQFDYTVPFPLSLVLNRKAIFRYQLIFRHLFSLRHTEGSLNDAWVEVSKMSMWRERSFSRDVESWKQRAWTLRARMSGFVAQITYYCTNEVIDPRFTQFLSTLSKVSTVDELMQNHEDFLDTCLKECMLTNQGLLRLYVKILTMCQAYAHWCLRLSRYLEAADTSLARPPAQPQTNGVSRRRHARYVRKQRVEGTIDIATITTMKEKLDQYEKAFERTVKVLLDNLNYIASTETISLLVLSSRLDWNKGFRDDAGDY
ncbi:putative Spindle pole body component [Taphrina deformans PYCC 5710]|uniref:Spindle pole body component n=1 Tax=Taphrina deformans (strain PYCC 5710 / ATCC 11124 / CBS 356.35 / IMI 108563 / JCM 9778 / NBRC 8474) TaxID=1097556 RepID=R4XC83_TAPDE|nr:putative Spindle pole body component [Taphrina deformans PYCC 5710]|eukprot:CCG83482.1 putative Spindle pole body component [Taphrina deformans PYCC 5710]